MYPFIPLGTGSSTFLITRTTAAAVMLGDVVTVDAAGEILPAVSTTSVDEWEVVGVSSFSTGIGTPVGVYTVRGVVTPMRFLVPPGAASNGDRVFLSSTPGAVTLNPPTSSNNTIMLVGILIGADGVTTTPEVIFHPQVISQIS